ncbi:anaphase-promoting complex subunit 11 [Enteropsectra breve]|nr:anaphase-promoting complex subunit 11 [Enteropsectra breve]
MEKKIQIINTYLKYEWKWKIKENICLICQQEFNVHCAKCTHPVECIPCTGQCTHTFHMHCLEEWLETSNKCPLCRSEWVCKKILQYNGENL